MKEKQKFAVMIGTGIFFPPEFSVQAREEIRQAIEQAGYEALLMPAEETTYGGVQSNEDGRKYAEFLKEHEGEFDGVILSLPNFGNENSAVLALRDCHVPILIQAYSDRIGQMDVAHRRDAFCGKFSVINQFHQAGLPYTVYAPHTIEPSDERFVQQIRDFAGVCRVVKGMKRFTVGAIGARTTPWKTVRVDEVALERMGITVETVDLSEVFYRVEHLDMTLDVCQKKAGDLKAYADWQEIPEENFATLVKTGVVLDQIIEEYYMDCIAVRCWNEFEGYLKVCPCILLSELGSRGMPAACEVDIANAISMRALALASETPSTVLDWNNNYGTDEEKCVLFHCGPVPRQMLKADQKIVDNPLQAMVHGPGYAWGSSMARFKESPMTYLSAKTENGKLSFYMGEGRFTEDELEDAYFGNGGVAQIPGLQNVLYGAGEAGYKHHVSVTLGRCRAILQEAFGKYLGYGIEKF